MASVIDADVVRHYRVELERPILEGVRLRIETGEHWAVIGANGSGKSTLLSIVSGDLWPSVGVVRVLGEEYGKVDKREHRKRIGVVSAELSRHLPLADTALEIAASGVAAMIGKLGPLDAKERERGALALARAGATSCAGKPFGVLSQGERQRVMIARALVNDPSLLILDEPCSGLDPVAREQFLEDLGSLAREPGGPTQLHVTHHLEEIPPHVSHALVLRDGRAVATGRAAEVLGDETLSVAFGAPCRVTVEKVRGGHRYRLQVSPS